MQTLKTASKTYSWTSAAPPTKPGARGSSVEERAMLASTKALLSSSSSTSPTLTTDRVDRTSFSSIKESHTGIAQSFTDSKTSSYLRHELLIAGDGAEEAVFDDANSVSSGSRTPPALEERSVAAATAAVERSAANANAAPAGGRLTASILQGCVCPGHGFLGWKSIPVRGKLASRSSGDLRSLGRMEWQVQDKTADAMQGVEMEKKTRHGKSAIEKLPMELLGSIIDQLATDIPPNGFTARNIDLMSLLLTSRSLHSATLATLYAQITIPHSRIFRKFLDHVSQHPALGTIVRRIDFSHFNNRIPGQTARERTATLNLTQETLLKCLQLTPNLREFLAQEHIEDELSTQVLHTLLTLSNIRALDFCACSGPGFRDAFEAALALPLPSALPLKRLSMHECTNLPTSTFTTLLPRLPHLTHLDAAHTRITGPALFSIPASARLTHLNLSKCASLSGSEVVEFLTTHPAAQELVYLNLSVDAKSHELFTAGDIEALLPHLPATLRSLNLKGSKMDKTHIPLLLPLTKHLEELGLGRQLTLSDVTRLFIPSAAPNAGANVNVVAEGAGADTDTEAAEIAAQLAWTPHALHYVDMSDLSSASLDLPTLFSPSSSPLLTPLTQPLEVLELAPDVFKMVAKSQAALARIGWCTQEAGRRGWLVRVKKSAEEREDNGARGWKGGATYWGMRKVSVARAEVGGMYGHYMFKR